jgi:hypothetical protein
MRCYGNNPNRNQRVSQKKESAMLTDPVPASTVPNDDLCAMDRDIRRDGKQIEPPPFI